MAQLLLVEDDAAIRSALIRALTERALALVLRTLAADRAVSTATAQAQSMAPLVTTLPTGSLRLTIDQINAETSTPVTVFLPSGAELGQPTPRSEALQLAQKGHSFTAEVPGGAEVLVAVEGLPGGQAVDLAPGSVPVRVSREDLVTCADILLENVFAHTPEGAALAVRLSPRAGGGAWLVVADDGPGFGDADPTQRGLSRGGSTGLGLDIARQIAEASGGTLVVGRSASGGGKVTVSLGSPAGPRETERRHRRNRLRLRA